MSKLFEILEIFNEIDFTCDCIKICETTMSDASNLLKKEPESQELKAIFNRAHMDHKLLSSMHEDFKMYYDELYHKYSRDAEFVNEVMNAKDIPEEYELIFAGLKADIMNINAIEKGC